MIKKIIQTLKSCYFFWKELLLTENKKKFIETNSNKLTMQAIVLLSSVLVVFIFYSCMKPVVRGTCRIVLQSEDNSLANMGGKVVGVEARRVTTGTTLREIRAIGTLKANAEVIIKSEIAGKIAEILFTEGTEVEKGQILIKFEDDIYKAEKDKCEAEYTLKKSEFDRVEKLYKQKVGSQKVYDEALGQMGVAKAQLNSAIGQLKRTVIKSPFSGTIGIMKGSAAPGNIIQQHTELVDIVDNSLVKVEFLVPAKFIEDIAVGQSVEITVDAFKDTIFSGTVDAIDSEVNQRNHSILVRAIISNKSGRLKHGMSANVKLITGEKSDVVLIDEDALDRIGSTEVVWIIDPKGRAYLKQVITGAKDVNGVEIVAGLAKGDIVVVSGQLKLTDGVKTRILNTDFEGDTTTSDKEDKTGDSKDSDETKEPEDKTKVEEAASEPTKDDKEDKTTEDSKDSDKTKELENKVKVEEPASKSSKAEPKEDSENKDKPIKKSFGDSVKSLLDKIFKPANKVGSK
jgi:membrane fusion protein (multidrug efflux system)